MQESAYFGGSGSSDGKNKMLKPVESSEEFSDES